MRLMHQHWVSVSSPSLTSWLHWILERCSKSESFAGLGSKSDFVFTRTHLLAQILSNSGLGFLKLQFIKLGWSIALSSKKQSEIVSPAHLRGVNSPQPGRFFHRGFATSTTCDKMCLRPARRGCNLLKQAQLLPHFGFKESRFHKTFC